jgi:large subunit ribosomal protein L31e
VKGKEAELTVSLRRIYSSRRTRRAATAMRYLRELIRKRTHAEEVYFDESVNHKIWSRGIEKPPRKVELKIIVEETREVETKDGQKITLPKVVMVFLKGHEPKEESSKKEKS